MLDRYRATRNELIARLLAHHDQIADLAPQLAARDETIAAQQAAIAQSPTVARG